MRSATCTVLLRRWAAWLILAMAAALGGCWGEDDDPGPTEVSATIGAAGGTLVGPDGAQVVIPAGALEQDTLITIARRGTGAPTDTPAGYSLRGATYEFTPHDIEFAKPVTMRMPVATEATADDAGVYRAAPGGAWERIEVVQADGFAEWGSTHFSWYDDLACYIIPNDPDPYPCTRVLIHYFALLSTPAGAVIPVDDPRVSRAYWFRASQAATVRLEAEFVAPGDCGDARATFTRTRKGVRQVLQDAPASLSPYPSDPKYFLAKASLSLPVSEADNGRMGLAVVFSCRRGYQPPSQAGKSPEEQRILAGANKLLEVAVPLVAPSVTVDPADQSVIEPATATFSSAASGSGTLRVLWQRSGDGGATWSDIAGATGATYTTPATQAAEDGARFRAVWTNTAGSMPSQSATLRVAPPPSVPVITTQPADQRVAPGASATFSAAATGTPAPTLQWEVSVDDGKHWTEVAGATGTRHTTPATVAGDSGSLFRMVARNANGSAVSLPAMLAVAAPLSSTPEGKLALGRAHACAVKNDYTVACWGANHQGQLGLGHTQAATSPTTVPGLTQVIAVSVGSRGFYGSFWGQSCAVRAGGTVWCWGRDSQAVDQLVPVQVAGIVDARAVAVGSGHACALDSQGQVWCWGFNIHGELGNGTVGNPQHAPGRVQHNGSALGGIVAIGAGDGWTCATSASGKVLCWGVDHAGGAFPNPSFISDTAGATHLAVGPGHACVAVGGGAVQCWGAGGDGQLGDGRNASAVDSVPVTGLGGATFLAAGMTHTCARRTTGELVCWGRANLGNASNSASAPGAAVTGLGGVVGVSAGEMATCALRNDGQVLCWGANPLGQLGTGDTSDSAAPTATSAGAVFWRP